MCNVKQCLLVLLYSIHIHHFVSSEQEICDYHDKPLNKTSETGKTTTPNLNSRFNPYLDEEKPRENLLRNFNFDYFDPNKIKSKDDFYAMNSDEIGVPMVRPPKPRWQAESSPYGSGPQVLPDVVMTPEEPIRRKLMPEVLGNDEKQLGRFLVEDTRRIIRMMQPNGEYKNYWALPPSPGHSYRHPSAISYSYDEPNRYSYQPRPRPHRYDNSQRNYINKEFSHPTHQSSIPQLSASLTASPMHAPSIPQPLVPYLPMYKAPPMHPLVSTAPSSDDDTLETDFGKSEDIIATSIANIAKKNDIKSAVEANQKVDSPYRVQLDLGEQTDKVEDDADATADIQVNPQSNYNNHHELIHPALQIPIPLPHPAANPMKDEKSVVVDGEKKSDYPVKFDDKDPEKSDNPTSEILKQLEDLLNHQEPQQDTKPVEGEVGSSKLGKSDDPTSEILKQLEDLLNHQEPQQDTTPIEGEIGNSKLEKSDDPTAEILAQLEDLLKDEVAQQNTSLVGSDIRNSSIVQDTVKDSLSDDVSKETNTEEDISQTPNANSVPEKQATEKDYAEIINALIETDNIEDLVKNPVITTDALKKIAQLLNIQQGNQNRINPLLSNDHDDTQPREEKNTHSDIKKSLDITNDNYTDVLSAIIQTDRVEDLVNNPNIGTDVLKEIAEILETKQESFVSEGNPISLDQLKNGALSTVNASTGAIDQENSLGLFPIGIETESGEVLPMSSLNASLASDGRANLGCSNKQHTRKPKRRSKTLRREDEGKELYYLGSKNKIVRIPDALMKNPLLSSLIANENILGVKLLTEALGKTFDPTKKYVQNNSMN